MKQFFKTLAAGLLAFAMFAAPAFAITKEMATPGQTSVEAVVSTAVAAGEVVVVIRGDNVAVVDATMEEPVTGDLPQAFARFDEALVIYAGLKAPAEAVGFILGDAVEGKMLILIFDANDIVIGGAFVSEQIISAALDYMIAGGI